MPIASLLILVLTGASPAPQEPLRFGVLARDEAVAADREFVRAARSAAALVNQRGGVDGAPVELVVEAVGKDTDLGAAVSRLRQAGVAGLIAPPERQLAAAAAAANNDLLPMLRFDDDADEVRRIVGELLCDRLRVTRVALLLDKAPAAREFAARFDKVPLEAPARIVCRFDVQTTGKKVAAELAATQPQLLLIDAEPEAAQRFVDQHFAGQPLPIVLTPRSYAAPRLRSDRDVFVVHGQCPAQAGVQSPFRRRQALDNGEPGLFAAEGFEAVLALARAFDAADSREPGKVMVKLRTTAAGVDEVDDLRGGLRWLVRSDALQPPLGVWSAAGPRLLPHTPSATPLPLPDDGGRDTATARRGVATPQRSLGEPFGTWRTRDFAWEMGSQWVLLLWADDGDYATADADLQQLGLSTGGAAPLVDHLVKEELLARIAASASTMFGRNADGSAIPGQSLRICFGVHLDARRRQQQKQRLWPARIGGDDQTAGGRAHGTFCRIHSSYVRRTVFANDTLRPPVTAADRELLDGSYVFGTDPVRDRRSERIRELLQSFAGSMSLTLAHEVGHLATLEHVTDVPTAIMNTAEGAGIDYRNAAFCPASRLVLEQRLGVVGAPKSRR